MGRKVFSKGIRHKFISINSVVLLQKFPYISEMLLHIIPPIPEVFTNKNMIATLADSILDDAISPEYINIDSLDINLERRVVIARMFDKII